MWIVAPKLLLTGAAAAAALLLGAGVASADDGPLSIDIANSCPTLAPGSTGECVRALQNDLNTLGSSIAPDGDYGPETTQAVSRFQSTFGQEPTGVATTETKQTIHDQLETQQREQRYDPHVSNPVCEYGGDAPVIGSIFQDVCGIVTETPAAG